MRFNNLFESYFEAIMNAFFDYFMKNEFDSLHISKILFLPLIYFTN
jgi:hypothetical protein